MMRYLFGFLCVCALGVVPLVGCFDVLEGLESPCEGVDCDDHNVCTRDWCTWGLGVTCHHAPVDDGRDCNLDGTTGTCLDGLCGAEHLCDGVLCDDDNLCTDDECGWDGRCVFAPAVSCSDGNPCTEDECDPADGTCYYVDKPNGTYCSWWLTPGTCEDGRCRTE